MNPLSPLKKFYLSLQPKKRYIAVVAFAALIIFVVSFSFFVANSLPEPRGDIFADRNFKYSPFELTDAYDICYEGIKSEHPDELLTSYMNELSTRYDERKNAYLVVVDIQLGDGSRSVAGKVYCTINPAAVQLTYYKEVVEGQGSIFSRTVGFLSKVVGNK